MRCNRPTRAATVAPLGGATCLARLAAVTEETTMRRYLGLLAALLALAPLPDAPLVATATAVYFGVLFLIGGVPPEIATALLRRRGGA